YPARPSQSRTPYGRDRLIRRFRRSSANPRASSVSAPRIGSTMSATKTFASRGRDARQCPLFDTFPAGCRARVAERVARIQEAPMKRASMLLAVAIGLFTTTATFAADALPTTKPEAVGLSPDRLKRLGQVLQREIDAKKFPGAVALVARKG